MGYVKEVETDELKLPSNPDFYWVKMKKRAKYGDTLAAQTAMVKVSPPQKKNGHAPIPGQPPQLPSDPSQLITEMETGAFVSTLLSRMIVEWNLTDANDELLPIVPESMEELDPEDGDFLGLIAQQRIGRKGGTPAEGDPFGKQSGARSTVSQPQTQT